MNATNRFLNRALLLVIGCVLAAGGAALILAAMRPPWASELLGFGAHLLRRGESAIEGWTGGAFLSSDGTVPAVIALVALLILLALCIAFITTRGGGRSATVVRVDSTQGSTQIDRSIAEAVVAGQLRERADVLSASSASFRVRRAPALIISLRVRQRAELPRVLAAAERAMADWDQLAGSEVPIVVHLAGRTWLDRWRAATRVR